MDANREAVLGYEQPAIGGLFDADGLRRALTALAHDSRDQAELRKDAVTMIRTAFQEGRNRVKDALDSGRAGGLAAARSLSDLQDLTIQVVYDFATKHFYYAQNPTA